MIDNLKIKVSFQIYNSSVEFINARNPNSIIEYSQENNTSTNEIGIKDRKTPTITVDISAEDFKNNSATMTIYNVAQQDKSLLSRSYNDLQNDGTKTILATIFAFQQNNYNLIYQGIEVEGIPNEAPYESIMTFKLLPHIAVNNKNILINVPRTENNILNTNKDLKKYIAKQCSLNLVSNCKNDNKILNGDIYEITDNVKNWLQNYFRNEFIYLTNKELVFFDTNDKTKHQFLTKNTIELEEGEGFFSITKTGTNTFTVKCAYNSLIQFNTQLYIKPKSKKFIDITHGNIKGIVIGYNCSLKSSATTKNKGELFCNIYTVNFFN